MFGVTVRPDQTLDEITVNLGQSSTGSVGAHKARQVKGDRGEGTCLISVAVGNVGRVDISADAARITTDETCDTVSKIADIVEPKLPA